MSDPAVPGPPARGTRPRNRRAITIDAATALFHREGYARLSVADVARATNVGSSAIHRQFGTKSQLLVACIRSELAPFLGLLEAASAGPGTPSDRLDEAIRLVSDRVVEHRSLGVLWQREARGLDELDQRMLRDELRSATRMLAALVTASRPSLPTDHADLLAWSAMGVLVSIGFHSLELPRDEYSALLADLMSTVLGLELGHPPSESARLEKSAPYSRRDSLLSEATELFATRGFGTVAVDEIGEAAGIAGPSIYSHFASKQEILVAAMVRGNERLRIETDAALQRHDGPASKVGALLDSYLGFAIDDRFLIRVIVSEVNHLEPEQGRFMRAQQRDYIENWTGLVQQFAGIGATEARIRVQAALLLVNDAVQTPHLQSVPGLREQLRMIAGALLFL